mgnify:CR=1 FL=1
MRQRVPVRPALLSLALVASFGLATPAIASQGQHAQIPPASAQRQPAPDLLALPRIDIPLPEHRPGDDTVQLAAGEILSLELPIVITALFEPGWEDLDETQQEILAPFAPEWNTWPMAEKRSWLAFADRMQQLPEAQRQRARRRILEWANMSPEERRIARLNHQNARRRPMPERVKEWERYQSFSYAERERLRHSEQAHDIAAAQRARAGGMPPPPGHMPPPQGEDMLVIIVNPESTRSVLMPPPPPDPSSPERLSVPGPDIPPGALPGIPDGAPEALFVEKQPHGPDISRPAPSGSSLSVPQQSVPQAGAPDRLFITPESRPPLSPEPRDSRPGWHDHDIGGGHADGTDSNGPAGGHGGPGGEGPGSGGPGGPH